MLEPLSIRQAFPADALNISQLISQVAHCFNTNTSNKIASWFLDSITPEAIADYINDNRYNYLTGFLGQTLAGVIAVRGTTHVHHLFVTPELHLNGVASKLWERAKADAIASGNCEGFSVRSSKFAVPVYERFGFRVSGVSAEKDGIVFVPMKLELSKENSDAGEFQLNKNTGT